ELQRALRVTDLAARYGGDEFVLVLVRTGPVGAMRVADMLRAAIEAIGVSLGFGAGAVSVSIGVAAHDPQEGASPDILDAADRALYRAKARGGNAVAAAFVKDQEP